MRRADAALRPRRRKSYRKRLTGAERMPVPCVAMSGKTSPDLWWGAIFSAKSWDILSSGQRKAKPFAQSVATCPPPAENPYVLRFCPVIVLQQNPTTRRSLDPPGMAPPESRRQTHCGRSCRAQASHRVSGRCRAKRFAAIATELHLDTTRTRSPPEPTNGRKENHSTHEGRFLGWNPTRAAGCREMRIGAVEANPPA